MLSLIVPVYKNEESLERLLRELVCLDSQVPCGLEVVFVVDGSPDGCFRVLERRLPALGLTARLLSLSRNYGSFAAIGAGLAAGRGEYFAVKAADLQEPPELILDFLRILESGDADVVFGCRTGRSDPLLSSILARAFWWLYRALVSSEVPAGGVDVFGCTRAVRDRLMELREAHGNLINLLFRHDFRRRSIGYKRARRLEGKSAWTFSRKLHYCIDSIFSFKEGPARALMSVGLLTTALCGAVLLWGGVRGGVEAPAYAAFVLALLLFGSLASLGLGIVGRYLWLPLQTSRGVPKIIVSSHRDFSKAGQVTGVVAGGEETQSRAAPE